MAVRTSARSKPGISKPEPVVILGVDPGTNLTGYALLQVSGSSYQLLSMGLIRAGALDGAEHPEKLALILRKISEVIKAWKPRHAAVEAPFMGKNIQSTLKLGRVQGVVMAAAFTHGLEVAEYSPRLVKKAVTGKGGASKEQVAAMLRQLLPELPSFEDHAVLDATDALAVAVCHANRLGRAESGATSYSGWDAFLKANPERQVRRRPPTG